MTITELIEKHYWGEHDRDKARQFAIELLEMVQSEGDMLAFKRNPNAYHRAILNALEELRK